MENFSRVTSHLLLKNMELNQGYESLILIPTLDDKSFIRDELGNYWRMTELLPEGVPLMFLRMKFKLMKLRRHSEVFRHYWMICPVLL